ncbi:MAG: hypothetical protein HC896_04990, partial [Bacteroidales bacterium]|nr:hypothetical protein [Bacteroidales bacterium]
MFQHLPEGIYDLRVTDTLWPTRQFICDACIDLRNPYFDTVSLTPIACYGETSPELKLTTRLMEGPYSYFSLDDSIFQAQNTFVDTILGSVKYTITAIDSAGCRITLDTTFLPPTPISIGYTIVQNPQNATSADGQVSIAVNGGTGTKTTQFKLDNTVLGTSTSDTMYTGLTIGTYTIVATDSNGCVRSTVFELEDLSLKIIIDTVLKPRCFGLTDASLTFDIANAQVGSYQLLYKIGEQITKEYIDTTTDWITFNSDDLPFTVNNLGDGHYYFYVEYEDIVYNARFDTTVVEPDNLITALTPRSAACGRILTNRIDTGSIELVVTGGTTPYTYIWYND